MSEYTFPQTNYIAKLTSDKKYIKICPFCNTFFSEKIDSCIECNTFLPSFPTSWCRSFTSVFLIHKVMQRIKLDLPQKFNIDELTLNLVEHSIIDVDENRKNDTSYWRGSPRRRTHEYLTNLKYFGFIDDEEKKEYSITELGNKIAEINSIETMLLYYTIGFMQLKISNKHDKNGFYSSYNTRMLFMCLKIIHDLQEMNKDVFIEHIALAIMCKDEFEEYTKALEVSKSYSIDKIQSKWFGKGQELNRVVRGVIVKWLQQIKLIEINSGQIFLSEYGQKIYEYFSNESKIDEKIIRGMIYTSFTSSYLNNFISLESNNRVGGEWEEIVKQNFEALGFREIRYYRDNKIFEKIQLPDEVLNSLTGGTRYNPDLIIEHPLWLIDPKNNVNSEMHKVSAYNVYGEIVFGKVLIISQKIMKKSLVERMKRQKLDNVLVIDSYALQSIKLNNFSREKIENFVLNYNEYYLNEEAVFTYLVQ